MPSQFRAMIKRERANMRREGDIADAVRGMCCPRCKVRPNTLRIEHDMLMCPSCGLPMLELPAAGPDWMDRYLDKTSGNVELALLSPWFQDKGQIAAMFFVGWLGDYLREIYTHVG